MVLDSSTTSGRVAADSHCIGGATIAATVSGNIWPMRLGTSSPKMMVTTVMISTTSAVAVTCAGTRLRLKVSVQPFAQRLGERGVADDAVEHADRRDAHLDGGQELGGMVVQVDRRLGAALARFQHHLQARLAARRQRHLRHRESGVQHDQEKEKGDVHREARRAGIPSRCAPRAVA